MTAKRLFEWVHVIATVWFVLCVGYLLAMALHHVGLRWWVVLSLSGFSAPVFVMLIALYLFAIFRGADGARRIEPEHPVTSTDYYLGFYVSAPLLGGLAAIAATAGVPEMGKLLFTVALGTLGTTFLVWIIIDPAAGMIEALLPASRRHRAGRRAAGR